MGNGNSKRAERLVDRERPDGHDRRVESPEDAASQPPLFHPAPSSFARERVAGAGCTPSVSPGRLALRAARAPAVWVSRTRAQKWSGGGEGGGEPSPGRPPTADKPTAPRSGWSKEISAAPSTRPEVCRETKPRREVG